MYGCLDVNTTHELNVICFQQFIAAVIQLIVLVQMENNIQYRMEIYDAFTAMLICLYNSDYRK